MLPVYVSLHVLRLTLELLGRVTDPRVSQRAQRAVTLLVEEPGGSTNTQC